MKKIIPVLLITSLLFSSCSIVALYVKLQLGQVQMQAKDYKRAAKTFETTLPLLKYPAIRYLYGDNDTVLLTKMLIATAGLFFETQDFVKVETYTHRAIEIYEKNKIDNTKELGFCHEIAGQMYSDKGNYPYAFDHLYKAEKIYKNYYGTNDTHYAGVLTKLAIVHHLSANYAQAEQYYHQSLEIYKYFFGEYHQEYAAILQNIAVFYIATGNYPKAESYLLQAGEIFKNTVGENHERYANVLNNLAVLYGNNKKYHEAEKYNIECLQVRKNISGKDHPFYASSLHNLGMTYSQLGEFDKAEAYFREAEEIIRIKEGKMHPDYARLINEYGNMYFKKKEYQKAGEYYNESLNIREKILGKTHPDYALTLFASARNNDKIGNVERASDQFLEALNISNEIIWKNFSFLSEKEKEMFFISREPDIHSFYTFSVKHASRFPELADHIYNNALRTKGLLLKSSTAMRNAVYSSSNEDLKTSYEQWVLMKKEIADLYSTDISKRKRDPEALELEAEILEKKLVKELDAFSDFDKLKNTSWTTVRNNLQVGEAAIEFLRFNLSPDSVLYIALIIKSDFEHPEIIPLFEEKQLIQRIGIRPESNHAYIHKLYGSKENPQNMLYNLIWQPLEHCLGGIKTIWYSPDGLLHKISFSALAKDKQLILCNILNMNQVSSTALIKQQKNLQKNTDLQVALYGGIDYSKGDDIPEIWPYLPATKTEVERIEKILKKNNIPTHLKTGNEANENDLKTFANKDQIIHIASHGFFFPDPENEPKTETEESPVENDVVFRSVSGSLGEWQLLNNKNPLMRSGLVMAGGNNVWSPLTEAGEDDGILTAYEVTQLNLSHTRLVVLSACETGLGDIKGSEGVYGLQRAFKMAGAEYIVMSLWQVPDKETAEFMEQFYQLIASGNEIYASFTETQKYMQSKYDPFFWAAFVLLK